MSPEPAHRSDLDGPTPGAPAVPVGWARVALFGLSFWALAKLSRYLSVSDSSYVPFWLPCGLYLSVLLLCPPRAWSRVLVAAFGANAAYDLLAGTPFVTLLGFYASNTVQVLSGAWLLRWRAGHELTLRHTREFFLLVAVVAGVAPALGAVLGAATLVASGMSSSFAGALTTWFANGAMANLLVVPFVLVWGRRAPEGTGFGSPARVLEFGLLVSGMLATVWALLVEYHGVRTPNKAVVFPFLLWAALRFGLHGVTLLNFVLAITVAFLTTRYQIGLTAADVASGSYVPVLQTFLAVSVIVALAPAIAVAERDRRSAQLRESQQRTQMATEATGAGVWEWELASGRTKWDVQTFRLFGVDPTADGSVSDAVWKARVLPDELPAQEAALRDALRTRAGGRREFRIRRLNDGAVRVIQAIDTVRLDAAGAVVSVVGTFFDVTERRGAEDALRASEERLRRLVENGNEVVSLYDASGTILYESAGVERVKGFTAAELVGTNAIELIHPDDLELATASLSRALAVPGGVERVELRCRHKDGTYRWLDFVATNLLHDPAIRALVGNYRDITAWRAAHERVRASSELLRKLSEQVPGMIYQYQQWPDGRGRFPYVSEGIRHVLEVAPESAYESAAAVFDRVHPDDRATLAAATAHSLETLCDWRCEFRVLLPERGERWLVGHARPERAADGSTLWHGNLSDATDRKRLEAQLLQAQKMEAVGQLAGGVAHDFNNLLTVITGAADALHDDLAPDDPRRALAASVLDAGERAAGVTARLLAFSRKSVVAPKVFDLNEVVVHSEKLLRRLIGENIALTVVPHPAARPVCADPNQIDQVILNLAVNARDAMPSGGLLRIETGTADLAPSGATDGPRAGRYALLSVSDSGCGMTDEVKARLFEPFFTTKEVGKGTGLGLATVYGIVKHAGGYIEVDSALGRGTTFRVFLPEVSAPVAQPGPAVVPARRGTETVLLAEDDEAVRAIATRVLESQGYTVIAAPNGREALDALRAAPDAVDVLVTDVVMPVMGGRELVDAARTALPDLPVLYISGYIDDAITRHGVSAGDAFLQKPFAPLALAHKVRTVLDSAGG